MNGNKKKLTFSLSWTGHSSFKDQLDFLNFLQHSCLWWGPYALPPANSDLRLLILPSCSLPTDTGSPDVNRWSRMIEEADPIYCELRLIDSGLALQTWDPRRETPSSQLGSTRTLVFFYLSVCRCFFTLSWTPGLNPLHFTPLTHFASTGVFSKD